MTKCAKTLRLKIVVHINQVIAPFLDSNSNYCLCKFSAIYHEEPCGTASIVSLKCLFKSFVVI